MVIATSSELPGRRYEALGLVSAICHLSSGMRTGTLDVARLLQGAAEHESRHGKSRFPNAGEAALLPWQATRSAPPAWQARGETVTAA
jgi:hypothetical protein